MQEESPRAKQEESPKGKQSEAPTLQPGQHTQPLPDGGYMIITDGFTNA